MIANKTYYNYLAFGFGFIFFTISFFNSNHYVGVYSSIFLLLTMICYIFFKLERYSEPPILILLITSAYLIPRQILHIELPIMLISQFPQPSYIEIIHANYYFFIGLLSYSFGYFLTFKPNMKSINLYEQKDNEKWEIYLLFLLLIFTLSSLILIFLNSGMGISNLQADAQIVLKKGINGILYGIYLGAPVTACAIAYILKKNGKNFLAMFVLFITAISTFILARREPLLFLLIGTLLMYSPKIEFSKLLRALFILLIVVFLGFIFIYFRVTNQLSSEVELTFTEFFYFYFMTEEFWAYDILLVIFSEAGSYSMPYRNGIDLIPRFLDNFLMYEFQYEPIDEIIGADYKPEPRNIVGSPFTIFGTAYLNLGIIGIVIALFALGIFSNLTYILVKNISNVRSFIISILLYIFVFFVFRNADLYHATIIILKLFVITLMPIYAIAFLKLQYLKYTNYE